MAVTEEPILSRLDRLDNMLREMEEIRGYSCSVGSNRSPKSSCTSSGTLTSEGQASWADLSPKSMEKHCRPMDRVMVETERKGTLIERIEHMEERMLKVCLQLEEELEAEKQREEKTKEKKGIKGLVKNVVKRRSKKHNNNKNRDD